MHPGDHDDMSDIKETHHDPTDGKNGANGGKDPRKKKHKELPADAIKLLQRQTKQNLQMMENIVYHMSRLAVGRPGPEEPGGSDPESSDSTNLDGSPKDRGPAYYDRQRRKTKNAIKRIGPSPTFRGDPGEPPKAHLLRTMDWFDAIGIATERAMLRSFKHLLDSNAREWFADLCIKKKRDLTWDFVTNKFSRYFSTQGRSHTHLHNAWKSFTFDPNTMDIEDFIHDVQECGSQLKYGDHSVMEMIKSCMPRENFGTLYKMHDLSEVITYCKDAYAVTPAKRAKKAA